MSYEQGMQVLAASAMIPAGATLFFFVFWRWFDYWRRHQIAIYTVILGTLVGLGVAIYGFRDAVFAHRVGLPGWVQGIGWVLVAIVFVFGFVADRQIGIRVRTFMPFFEDRGRIELQTDGAYGVVRHPLYAAGIGYQLGVFLVAGYLGVVVAGMVFALGAVWFTRQEERRLIELLADPAEYQRYRERVPALLPWPRPGLPRPGRPT